MVKNEKPKLYLYVIGLVCILILFSACGGANAPLPDDQNNVGDSNSINNVVTEELTEEPTAEPPTQPPGLTLEPLAPDRQPIQITTSDGRTLEGFYYPAGVNPAPVVVLMHWAGGDMDDWKEIAPWLQNRSGEMAADQQWLDAMLSFSHQGSAPWLDPTWFPIMPEEISFGAVVFNFGDFGNSPAGNGPESWLDDAVSAVQKASELQGVDPMQVSTIGASIGADGSIDGCYLFNKNGSGDGSCQGALSLSPGNYLTKDFTYHEAVAGLDEAGKVVWCLAAENDNESGKVCKAPEGEKYKSFIYSGGDHGMRLVDPALAPADPPTDKNALELIIDFLAEVYGLSME